MDMGFDNYIYIVKVFEGTETYEYEFGNLLHALQLYDQETTAELIAYRKGKETVIRKKKEIQPFRHMKFQN